MTTEQLVKMTAAMPELKQLLMPKQFGGLGIDVVELESMLQVNVVSAITAVSTAYEWDFSTRRSSNVDTVASTADYAMEGAGNDCLQVIAVTYGDDETPIVFQTKDQMRDKLTYSAPAAMSYWIPERRDSNERPVIRIVGTPVEALTLQYEYFRNNVEVGEMPDSLGNLLRLGLARTLMPTSMEGPYRTALAEAIGSLERETGHAQQAVMDTDMRNRNIERAARHVRM